MKENFMGWEKPGRALITGASSGIGMEFAEQLAAQGFTPVLIARRKDRLEKLAASIKSKYGMVSEVIITNLAKRDDIVRLAKKINKMKDIDVVINNAGFGLIGKYEKIELQKHIDMMEVHNIAPVILTHQALPSMLERGRGVIIYTSSMAGFLPCPGGGLYTPTKAFLIGLAKSLSLEMLNTEISIQALCPGFTHTEFHDEKDLKRLKSALPGFIFGSTGYVVRKSLIGARKRKTVVIPGMINKLAVRFMPKRLMMGAFNSLNAE